MANRSYTARVDFNSGWDISVNRYDRPGAIADMVNAMLDPLAEGAIRQSYGPFPFGFTGYYDQAQTTPPTDERFNGICYIGRINQQDWGTYDNIIVGAMEDVGGTTTVKFYWLTTPDTTTRIMNFPFGDTYTIINVHGNSYRAYYTDWIYMVGELNRHSNISASKVSGSGSISDQGSYWKYDSSGTGTDTMSILFTHDDTGETHTVTVIFNNQSPGDQAADNYVVQPHDSWYNQFADFFDVHTGSIDNFYWNNGGGAYTVDTSSATAFARRIYVESGNLDNNTLSWEDFFTVDTLSIKSILAPDTTSMYVYALWPFPMRAPETSQTEWAHSHSAAMKEVHSISNVVQVQNVPYGIWKSAAMNGQAFFYSGIDTPFKLDIDDPTTTGTIGLDRPDTTTYTVSENVASTSTAVKGVVKYWIAEVDEDGQEGALSLWFPDNSDGTTTGNDTGTAEGWDAGDGMAVDVFIDPVPNTVSGRFRLYRSFADRASPYFLDDVDAGTATTYTYTDETIDALLGDLPFAHGDPPPTDFFCPVVYYDRVWGLGTRQGVADARRTTLFWTDINSPESFWWDGNWANVYADDGDEVTCLVRTRTGLVVFKNNHTYRMVGRIPEDIAFVEITSEDSDTGVGCPHPNAAIATDAGVFFYWNGAVYAAGDGNAVDISKPISPLLRGREGIFGLDKAYNWQQQRAVDDWSVNLSYDPKTKILYFSYRYQDDGIAFNESAGQTLMFDVRRGVWSGQYEEQYGFFRRCRVPVVNTWDTGHATYTVGYSDALLGAALTTPEEYSAGSTYTRAFHSTYHPLIFAPGYAGQSRHSWTSSVKFRPIVGNLGPITTKRFLWVDWLFDDVDPRNLGREAEVQSKLYLDGSASPDTDTLTVNSGAIYSDRVRHVLGSTGAEVEPEFVFDSNHTGNPFRLFEYSITWQNLGKYEVKAFASSPITP